MPISATPKQALIVVVAVVSTLTSDGFAQRTTVPLRIEDAIRTARFQQVTGKAAALSPDGASAAYTVCTPVERLSAFDGVGTGTRSDDRSDRCGIRITEIATGETRNLTTEAENDWGPAWSPDSRSLAYYSERHAGVRVWIWDRGTMVARELASAIANAPASWESPVWSPDGKLILAKVKPVDRAVPAKPPRSTARIFHSPLILPLVSSDSSSGRPGAEDIPFSDLVLFDTDGNRVSLLASRVRATTYSFSPDGSRIAFLECKGRISEGERGIDSYYSYTFDLSVVTWSTGRRLILARDIEQWQGTSLSWSPDGRWLAYLSGAVLAVDEYRSGYAVRGDLYVVESERGTINRFAGAPSGTFDSESFGALWDSSTNQIYLVGDGRLWQGSPDSGHLAAITPKSRALAESIVQESGTDRIWRPQRRSAVYLITRDSLTKRAGVTEVRLPGGETRQLRDDAKYDASYYHPPVGTRDGSRLVFRAESAQASEDLWVSDPLFRYPRRLTRLNPQFDSYEFGQSRILDYVNGDGLPLQATLLLPPDYVPGRRYPLIVWVYAGVYGSHQANAFGLVGEPFNLQMLTTRGYAVLWPDMPIHTRTPVEDMMKCVMPAVDQAVAEGFGDHTRLALMGQSNGGYSVLALLTRTQRFRAAVVNSGFGNLASMYGDMTDDGLARWIPWFERVTGGMGAAPWDSPLRYVDNSPVFFLDRIHTPVLIQAGGADEGLVAQSDEIFVGLRRLGREAIYLRYEDEGHFPWQPANRLDYWRRVLAFLAARLSPR